MMKLLDRINNPNDIKQLSRKELKPLAQEIREFLIEKVSHTGGHLASNLGCVEITMALHRVMNFPEDKIIWDVGHQSYVHKILTGRKNEFDTLRQLGGLSGFPKTSESDCDAFNTGHSSTSMSAALGMACARDIRGEHERIAAVIGDGSFTGGLVYEALNNMGSKQSGCLIVLNDNEMSIDENVGGMSTYLSRFRVGQAYNEIKGTVEKILLHIPVAGEKLARGVKRSKDSIKQMLVPGMFFEDLGVTYIGPIDGHDIELMSATFEKAFQLDRPIIVHVKTVKGKGYKWSEKHPSYFHGVAPFDVETGKVITKSRNKTYTGIFGRKLVELAAENKNIVAITAAMAQGTGLAKFAEEYPDRFFDVGIAEEHAVTFAAGLAAAGMTPVVAIYSSFLQRAYDQILHDVCLQNLHVVFAIDRAGLVGPDGETHQGLFDIAYMSQIPGMTIVSPKNRYDLTKLMEWAVSYDGPVAIRYAKGEAYYGLSSIQEPVVYGKSEYITRGSGIAVLAVGQMVYEAEKLYNTFLDDKKEITVVNARFVKPVDHEMIDELVKEHEILVVMEEGIKHGGYAAAVEEYIAEKGYRIKLVVAAVDDCYVKQGSIAELRKLCKLDADSVYDRIKHAEMEIKL